MNMMQGEFFLAVANKSLTLDAPTPTNISINSAAEIEMKGTPASPATAFARSVLPVPGGPIKSAPLGIFAPICVYLSGDFKKSTISTNSYFASSTPATSSNFTPVIASSWTLALDLDIPEGSAPPNPMLVYL